METRTAGAHGQHTYTVGECEKRTYPRRAVAVKLAKRCNQSGGEHQAPYHCNRCHGWHLGTDKKLKDERRALKEKGRGHDDWQ